MMSGKPIRDASTAIGLLVMLSGLVMLIAYCEAGCSPTAQEKAEHAIVVATYERELDACRERGKLSHSYEVYEACARAVDKRMCTERGLRCSKAFDGGADAQ